MLIIVDSLFIERIIRDVGFCFFIVYIVYKYIFNFLIKVCFIVGFSKFVEVEDIFNELLIY